MDLQWQRVTWTLQQEAAMTVLLYNMQSFLGRGWQLYYNFTCMHPFLVNGASNTEDKVTTRDNPWALLQNQNSSIRGSFIKHSGHRETCWTANLMRPDRLSTQHFALRKDMQIQTPNLHQWTQNQNSAITMLTLQVCWGQGPDSPKQSGDRPSQIKTSQMANWKSIRATIIRQWND